MTLHQNYRVYWQDSTCFAVRDNVERDPELFRQTGDTTNPRATASADAVLYDDQLLDVCFVDGRFAFQDPWAGVRARIAPTEWFDDPVPLFDRLSPADSIGAEP